MTSVFALLCLFPLALMIFKGLPFVGSVLADSYFRGVLFFTFKQALISTALSLVIGLPGAYLMAKKKFASKRIINSIYRVPFVLPSILTVLGFVIFYGNNGILNRVLRVLFGCKLKILYSFKAVLLAHTFYNFPVVVSLISDTWKSFDCDVENAAISLGASKAAVFFYITLPRLKGAILSAMSLVFLYCYSSFAIILVLGGSPDLTTSEVEIYRLGRILLDTDKASALALCSSVLACIVLIVYRTLQIKDKVKETKDVVETPLKHPVVSWFYLIASCLFILCPVLSIIGRSFVSSVSRASKTVFSLSAYSKLDAKTLVQTLVIGFLSSFLSLSMAVGFCKRKIKSELPVLIPLATSSVILGLGYFIITKYLSFISPLICIVLVHSIINTGFAYKGIETSWNKVSLDIIQQAKIDGASNFRILTKVRLPIIKRSLITSYMFCFVLSCGELNSTLLLGYGNIQTIPIAIYRLIGSYNYQGACALGSVLILICFGLFNLGIVLSERK